VHFLGVALHGRVCLSYNHEVCNDEVWFSAGKSVALLGCCITGGIEWIVGFVACIGWCVLERNGKCVLIVMIVFLKETRYRQCSCNCINKHYIHRLCFNNIMNYYALEVRCSN